MAIFIPEIELHNTLKAILTLIREDYESRSNKEHTLLYKILGSNRLQRYNLYEQGKKVFLAKEDDPRFLDVQMFFNMKRASIPTIHITLPSEQAGQDGLGIDEGYADPAHDEMPSIGDPDILQTSPNYTRRFDTTYNIIITSDNTNEVILIYHLLRAILIPVFDHLNQVGIENCKIGGRDIQAYPSLVPDSIFMRGLSLSFSYQITSPGIFKQDVIQKIILDYSIEIELPVDEDEDSSDITPTRPNYLTCSTLPYCDVIQQIEADIEELQGSQGVSIHNNLQGLNDGEYQHLTVAEKNTLHTHSNKSILDLITETFTTALKTAYDSTVTWITTNGASLIAHLTDTNNPHNVTAAQIGLGNVDNVQQIPLSYKGAINGVAELDFNGKVPLSQLNDSVIGQVEYQGTWNATTNTPTLPAANTTKGHYYITSVAGIYNTISFEVGDWVISDGVQWGKVDNTDAVSTVFGRIGNVTAQNNDYTWGQIDKTTSSLADLTTKEHSDLDNIQGGTVGEHYHLTQAEHGDLTLYFDEGFTFVDVETAYYTRNENFKINTIENPDALTVTIEVNGTPYTLEDPINAYDEVTVDVSAVGFVVLNCESI